ncbi:GNAT family N-acetyltransferase [Clostridium sp. E02]|uniref:GNAT family N-acetyltransferase n=1 Tax=Clostridium sp. E02 TaxID=2487134 RepID=UPI000F53CD25|nr:GNAT family N-acetyltransferase [Clostridium sp. E02]
MGIVYRVPSLDELEKVSVQIVVSYVAAYEGQMDHEYLSSLKSDHWVPILQESINNGDICLIAEGDGVIIGSTVFGVDCNGQETYAQWHAFYLLPHFIGIGVGHAFYQQIEKEMIGRGCEYCELEVLSSNKRAIQFYLSHGFTKTKVFQVEEYGMSLSCDIMKKVFKKETMK